MSAIDRIAVIKTWGLVAGFLMSLGCLVLLALLRPGDGPLEDQVVVTLQTICLTSGATIGILRLADVVSQVITTRTIANAPGLDRTGNGRGASADEHAVADERN